MVPISDLMTRDVITVAPQTPIFEALEKFTHHKISGMPVVDSGGRVIGILSEKDLLRILFEKKVDVGHKVEDYMSREVICFSEDDTALDVCKFFMRTHIRRVPIVNRGYLVGIVSRRDIIGLIIEAKSKLSTLRYV